MIPCLDFTLNCLDTYTSTATAIGSIATAITLYFIIRAFGNERKQLFIANFSEITDHIGDETTKEYRRWLTYDKEKMKLLSDFINAYDKDYYEKPAWERLKYDEIEKACWHIASRYDRVGVILDQDKKLKKEFLKYHREPIILAYKALKDLLGKRDKIFQTISYEYFQNLGKKLTSKT